MNALLKRTKVLVLQRQVQDTPDALIPIKPKHVANTNSKRRNGFLFIGGGPSVSAALGVSTRQPSRRSRSA